MRDAIGDGGHGCWHESEQSERDSDSDGRRHCQGQLFAEPCAKCVGREPQLAATDLPKKHNAEP